MITNLDMPVQEAAEFIEVYVNQNPQCLILDVGGGMRPLPYATHVIDVLRYDQRCWYGSITDTSHESFRFDQDTWLVTDLCNTPWPYQDKQFDIVWCTQTVEDLRDPIGVIREISRVGKQGYISSIHRSFESQLNVDNDKGYAGYVHHRWLLEISTIMNGFIFTFKYPLLHSPVTDKYRPKIAERQFISVYWEDSIDAVEKHLMSMQAIEDELMEYASMQNKKAGL